MVPMLIADHMGMLRGDGKSRLRWWWSIARWSGSDRHAAAIVQVSRHSWWCLGSSMTAAPCCSREAAYIRRHGLPGARAPIRLRAL